MNQGALPRTLAVTSLACALAACGASDPVKTSGATDAEVSAMPSAPPTSAPTDVSAEPSASPVAPAGSATQAATGGAPKDADALVIEPAFALKGGGKVDAATEQALLKAFADRVAKSSKLASKGEKGVSKPRRVTATFMIEKPVNDKKGLTIRMSMNGVEPDGKCPLFDLDQNLTMSGGKSTEEDVLELRKAAVASLLEKLEPTAPTLKPAANCTAFKNK